MFNVKPPLETFGAAGVVATIIALILLAWLALRPAPPPRPQGPEAPADAFAASRALPALRFLTRAPRPVASEANARARQYIVERLESLELAPEVQTASAQKTSVGFLQDYRVSLGVVNNIVVRKPGSARDRARRPALLVATHYDSDPDRLGAADAGASVAAMLETLRALQHGAPLYNDVIFLFADAAKSGALGARAFADQHRWAGDVGLVLEFDAAGNSGPLLLTGTRGGNGNMIAGWIESAPVARGTSALEALGRVSPGLLYGGPLDTLGVAGLRFANIEGRTGYSGALDLPSRVAQGTMQHAGETMLALTRHFGKAQLSSVTSADSVHFELPFAGHVLYSSEHVWPITRLVCFMFLLACCLAVQHLGMELRMLLAGAMAFVMLAFALALTAITLWKGWPSLHANYNPLGAGAGARDHWYFLAYTSLGIALFIELQRLMHKTIGVPATTLGALLVVLLMLVLASGLLPGASYLLAWPLISALLAYGLLQAPRVTALPQAARLAIMLAAAAPAVLLLAPLLHNVSTLFTPQRSATLMIVLTVMLGLVTPLLTALRRRFVAPLLLMVCVGAVMTAGRTRQYDGETTRPNQMVYLKDSYSWKAWWALPAGPLDAWSRPFFTSARAPRELREVSGMTREDLWVARAPNNQVMFPDIVMLRDEDGSDSRKVEFTLRSKNKAPTIELRLEGADMLSARLDGKVVTDKTARFWSMSLHGTGDSLHRFELALSPGSIARIYIAERIPGLPGNAGGTRPAHTPLTETTLATDMLVLR